MDRGSVQSRGKEKAPCPGAGPPRRQPIPRRGSDTALNSSPKPCTLPIPNTVNSPPLTAVLLVLAVTTVVLAVAAENAGNAAVGVGAFELAGQADVDIWEGRQHGQKLTRCISALLGRCSTAGVGGSQGEVENLPQLASSELSWQSLSPSQMKAGLVQIPVEHWNCPGLHLNSAVGQVRPGETFALGNIFRANLNLPLSSLGSPAGTEQPAPNPGIWRSEGAALL